MRMLAGARTALQTKRASRSQLSQVRNAERVPPHTIMVLVLVLELVLVVELVLEL